MGRGLLEEQQFPRDGLALGDIEWVWLDVIPRWACVLRPLQTHGFAASPGGALGLWTGSWIWQLAEACSPVDG